MTSTRRRWLFRAGIVAGLIATYALVGFVIVPWVARDQLLKRLPEVLHRPVEIGALELDPFDVRIEVRGFRVLEPSGKPLVGWSSFVVDLALLSSLGGKTTFEEITLTEPVVTVELLRGGRLNFSDLLERPATEPETPAQKGSTPVVRIRKLAIRGGSIDFTDRREAEPFHAELAPLSMALDDFTTEPAQNNAYALTAQFGEGSSIGWSGDFSLDPVRSSGRLSLEGISLAPLAPYLRASTQLRLTSAIVGLKANYQLDLQRPPGIVKLSKASFTLKSLALLPPDDDEPVLSVGALNLTGIDVDARGPKVRIGALALADVAVRAVRSPTGQLDLQAWAAPPARTTTVAAPASTSTSSFSLQLDEAVLAHVRFDFLDRSTPTPARWLIDQLGVRTSTITLPRMAPIDVSAALRINERARLSAEGTVDVTGQRHRLALKLSGFPLAAIQPYLEASLTAVLAQGALDADLDVQLEPASRVHASGRVEARELSLLESAGGKELVGFGRLGLVGLDYQGPPGVVKLAEFQLDRLRTRYELITEQRTNFSSLTRPQPSAPPAESGPGTRVELGKLVLKDGAVDVFDRRVKPPVAVKLSRIEAKLAPLTFPIERTIKLDVAARVDAAPLSIKGSVLPKGKDSVVDLAVQLKGWDLNPLSPYFGKYAGYPIEKGKLSLDLTTKVGGRKLDAQNNALVDQLELGDKTDSPDATWLPVKLGLAILTDRSGKIELELPATGELDDPEFGVGKIVWKTLLNVLEKVATSPFALLGSLFGGSSEDLSEVPFPAGSATLEAPAAERVDKVAKALYERPKLSVSVTGFLDPEADALALARDKLREALSVAARDRLVAAKKLQRGAAPTPLDTEAYRAAVAERYAVLSKNGTVRPPLFGARTSSLASTNTASIAPAGAVDDATMERAVLADFGPSAQELATLRGARARAVQEELIKTEGVGTERVFLVEPKADDPTAKAAATMTLR